MGMTWIFAFISIHTKNIVFEYFFIITNGLQGAFIFVAFDLKKKVWEELSIKTRCLKKHENYTVRRKSKAFTASLEGVYKSRPNSQRFNELRAHSASLDASRSQPSHTTAEIEADSKTSRDVRFTQLLAPVSLMNGRELRSSAPCKDTREGARSRQPVRFLPFFFCVSLHGKTRARFFKVGVNEDAGERETGMLAIPYHNSDGA
ncbi:hypothetical protein O3P69_016545 [Scylla paramamosain]|uniref:Uncharacterized protein n=1 Tax=Scylla paramamosain TaxID=85552 RepID=A0AAW0TGU1_SCYPA